MTLRDLRQVTLPAEVVAAVGLETNGSLEVRVVAASILLTPIRSMSPNSSRRVTSV